MWRTVFGFALVIPTSIIIGIAMTLSGLLFFPRFIVDKIYYTYSSIALVAMGARMGKVVWHVPPDALPPKAILVCNHESLIDTQAIVVGLIGKRSMRWVGKRPLFLIPLFGWALWFTGNVPVSRGNTKKDVARLNNGWARRRDRDIVFFPEGTRSRTGELAPFKKGAFVFAIQNQRPILPMGIAGGAVCLPADSLRPKTGTIVIVVGSPINVAGLTYADRDALKDKARSAIVALRQQAQDILANHQSNKS